MSIDSAFAQFEPRYDAIAKLLLLSAKTDLSPEQKETARSLALSISDWESFVEISNQKFTSTFSYRALLKIAADIVPPDAMEKLRTHSRQTSMDTLRVVAAQLEFHKRCIESTNAQHAYMKGIALTVQYNRNVADRYCRDIDVLVASKDFDKVIKAALGAGYKILLSLDPPEVATSEVDFQFVSKCVDEAIILDPSGVLIEVHRKLGKMSISFDLQEIMHSADTVTLSGVKMRTPSKAIHFVYICYHHSRHFWSRLHWLTDLDSMIRAPDLDRAEINRLADKIGIRPTVDAAFDFHQLTCDPSLWDDARDSDKGGAQFLKVCLVNLNGGLSLEKRIGADRALGEFMSEWQVSKGSYFAMWRTSWFRRLRPSVSQHLNRRRPSGMYWLYYLENAWNLITHARLFGPHGANSPTRAITSRDEPNEQADKDAPCA